MKRPRILSWTAVAAGALLVAALSSPATAEEEDSTEPAPEAAAISTDIDAPVGSISQTWDDERRAAAEPVQPPTELRTQERTGPVDDVLPDISGEGEQPDSGQVPTPDSDGEIAQTPRAELWDNHGSMPAQTVGKLYFVNDNGQDAHCTASVITSDNRNTVWTAGHCLHPGEGGSDNWFSDVHFVPDTDNGQEPLGEWEASRLVSANGWLEDGNLSYDLGAVELRPHPERGDIQDATGAQGYRFGQGQDFDDVTSFGYPAEGFERDDFNGDRLWHCNNPTERVGWFDDQLSMDCDMHSGASGGPWLDDLQTDRGWGYIISALSHRLVEDGELVDLESRAPNHGDAAINIYENVTG